MNISSGVRGKRGSGAKKVKGVSSIHDWKEA